MTTTTGDFFQNLQNCIIINRSENVRIKPEALPSIISEQTLQRLKRKNIVQRSQYLSVSNYHENVLYLKDAKHGGFVEIWLKDDILFCQNHESTDCVHVDFARAQPEVRRRLGLRN